MDRVLLIKYFEKFYPTESHSSLTDVQLLTKINDYRGFREGDSELGLELLNFGQPADLRKFSRNFLKSEVILKELQGKTQEATENIKGIMSKADIGKMLARLAGGSYGGVFGTDLTAIEKDKMYVYINGNDGAVYKARNTKANSSGFLVPSATDFIDITNNNISKYESFMEARMVTGSNGVSIQLTFVFQKVGRIVNFSIVNTSITPGVTFNDDSTLIDFNNANYAKFKPTQFGVAQGGTFWIEEYPLIRTHTTPVNVYGQFVIARLVLMSNRMSIFGIGGLGTFDAMRVSGSYIAAES